MGRLIDADKLDELAYEDAYGCKCVSMHDIDAQPTTYDVDNVVKQLKKEFKKLFGENWNKAQYLVKTIEIVKGGGIDAKTNF